MAAVPERRVVAGHRRGRRRGLVVLALATRSGQLPWLRPAGAFVPWAAVTVLVATGEELLLRGALFDAVDEAGGTVALLVTSVVFALLHVPLYGWHVVPLDLGVGLWLGGLRLATGGVAAPARARDRRPRDVVDLSGATPCRPAPLGGGPPRHRRGTAAAPTAPPLYDGIVPSSPTAGSTRRRVSPAAPKGATADIPVRSGKSPLVAVATPELEPQAQIFAQPDGLTVPPGAVDQGLDRARSIRRRPDGRAHRRERLPDQRPRRHGCGVDSTGVRPSERRPSGD